MNAPSSHDRTGRSFEVLVAEVMKILLGEGTFVQQDSFALGKSGVLHQIDLEVVRCHPYEHFEALVECKDYNRPVNKEKVSAFVSVIQDVNSRQVFVSGYQQGILVSSHGFHPGAIKLAREKGITLLEVREPDGSEWEYYASQLLEADGITNLHRQDSVTLEIYLKANEAVRVFPDEERISKSAKAPWDLDSAQARNPEDLLFSGKPLWETSRTLQGEGKEPAEGDRICRRRYGKWSHREWKEPLPVKKVEFSYVDLSEDAKEAVLYGAEKPDLLLWFPVEKQGYGIKDGKCVSLGLTRPWSLC